jgi:hypothetical protein
MIHLLIFLTLGFAICAAVTGIIAAIKWFGAGLADIYNVWSGAFAEPITPEDADKYEVWWPRSQSARLNLTAALWTVVSVLFNAAAAITGAIASILSL